MAIQFAQRMTNVKKSFIREILKVTENPQVISFAGGLPNPASFPVQELAQASQKVLLYDGGNALQYSTTEGYLPLREFISNRYFIRHGLKISPEEIMITNGSQQGIDLIGKVFINKGDNILIERPGYLGAIQAFSIFEPTFNTVTVNEIGVDLDEFSTVLNECNPKLFYAVPNFQNPSGITYSRENREKAAKLLQRHDTIFIEDDPYGELRFIGEDIPSMKCWLGENAILLGSFSKIVSPAMRLGWICAKPEIMEKLLISKQASDLHTNYFSQRVVYEYLKNCQLDEHIKKIKALYKSQRDNMATAMEKYFPKEATFTKPEGGMFMWVTLPKGVSSMELFEIAAKENVAFVPGMPFYVDDGGTNTLRLNYTNCDELAIEEGIRRLALSARKLIDSRTK